MEDIKLIIARNLAELRRQAGMTQLGLAEQLNYSDKAVSKWERGESIPDITVLKAIADLFGVTVDYLITAEHKAPEATPTSAEETTAPMLQKKRRKHGFITGMSILLVWLIATLLFIILDAAMSSPFGPPIPFMFAVPISMIVWLIMNSIWFDRRRNFLIVSLLMWSLLVAIYLCTLLGGVNLWLLFALGVPGQAIILLWSGIGRRSAPPAADASTPAAEDVAQASDAGEPSV